MEIQRINCMVGFRQKPEDQDFKLMKFFGGKEAIPASEIPILQALNGLDCISEVSLEDSYETTKKDEWDRLHGKYRAEYIAMVYPSASVPLIKGLDGIELEPSQFARKTA